MKTKKIKKIKQTKGITLVALVITIVILIILSVVTINMAFGENGLVKYAEEARDKTANSTIAEAEGINSMVDQFANVLAEDSEIEEPFEPQPTPEPPTGGKEIEDNTNGIVEIKWLSGTSNNVSEEPNGPVIKTDLPSGTKMEQVVFDEGSQEWIAGTEYIYIPGTGTSDNTASKWANAKVTKDGIESYFVWIPRYAYRIIYFDSVESKQAYQNGTLTEEAAIEGKQIIGYSDSRGIVDAQGRKIDGVESTTKTMVSEDYFMVHPAFMDGTETNFENGEWNQELAGIWIGKYEASLANKADGSNIVTNDALAGNILLSDQADKAIVTKPGYSSWRYITIGNMYTNVKAYDTNLKSHMLKNSEWGAVAYLTESKYGRNGNEIGFSGEGYITGGGEDNAYATTNQNQSSTGNVYGIYDLRGGAYEYVATYYSGGDTLNNGSSFTSTKTSDEYSTVYIETSAGSAYKYGDATYETSGWHLDTANFLHQSYPYFGRGEDTIGNDSLAGVFSYSGSDGNAYVNLSSRVALVV